MIMIAYYARAPHCPQNGPWTGAPHAVQNKLRPVGASAAGARQDASLDSMEGRS